MYLLKMIAASLMVVSVHEIIGAELPLSDNFDAPSRWKTFIGRSEYVDNGGRKSLKVTAPAVVTRTWDLSNQERREILKYRGISFRVKGCGENEWVLLTVSGYGAWTFSKQFQIRGSEWNTMEFAWEDFTPAAALGDRRIGDAGGMPADGLNTVTFGDVWEIASRNEKIKPFSYEIDDLKLVKDVVPKTWKQYRPSPISGVFEKMKSGKPVSIFCAGDSITVGVGMRDPNRNCYGTRLQDALRKLYGNEKIEVTTIAVGGARSWDLRIWAERDFLGKKPDLVTIHIGYNDKTAALPPDLYKAAVSDYIDRISSITEGSASFLLLATLPGQAARFSMMDDYAAAIRMLAEERGIAMCDLAACFKELGKEKTMPYFVSMSHPNKEGHIIIAEKLANWFAMRK